MLIENLDTQPILGRRRGALVCLSSTSPKDPSTLTATASSTTHRITHLVVTRGVTRWLHCHREVVQGHFLSCAHKWLPCSYRDLCTTCSPVTTGICVQRGQERLEKNEGITSSSASNHTIVVVRLELTNMHAFIAFIDDSLPFLSHNKSWRYLQEIQKSNSMFNKKYN